MKATYKKGGKVKSKVYAGADSNVMKEAMARKSGGKCVSMDGGKAKAHLGKAKRASGGRTGADMSPLSSAYKAQK
jgi:hypothetical protein